MKPHRIAGGAIVIVEGKVLLVRYPDAVGGTYLAAPGGAAQEHESVAEAAVREVLEETGIVVASKHVVAVEDLLSSRFKMCKVWLLCTFVSGQVRPTEEAKQEGIIEARWYDRSELIAETVYPALLKEADWSCLAAATWSASSRPMQSAAF